MRLPVGKRVIPVFVVVVALIFSTIGLVHMKTELIQQQRVSVQTAMSYEDVSCKSTGVCEIDEVHTRRISRLIFLERQRVSMAICVCICCFPVSDLGAAVSAFERNVRSIHEHCSRKRNLVISYIHSQDGQKHRDWLFASDTKRKMISAKAGADIDYVKKGEHKC